MKKIFNGILALTAGALALTLTAKVNAADKTDILNNEAFGIGNVTSYKDVSFESINGAKYLAQAAGSKGTIQLRSKNNNSGIVTTVSAGNVKSIELTWNEETSAGRKVDIYGKNTAYEATTDLYSDTTSGTLLASSEFAGTTTVTIDLSNESDTQYIGIRSNNGALYLDSIKVVWASSGEEETTYKVKIDAGIGSFKEGTSTELVSNIGEKTEIDLKNYNPTAPYPYSELSGWSDGTNEYSKTDIVSVEKAAIIKATYQASKTLTVEEAIEVSKAVGSGQTAFDYTVKGKLVSVDNNKSVVITDNEGNEFTGYRSTLKDEVKVGDIVSITGSITEYLNYANGEVTPEMVAGCVVQYVGDEPIEDKIQSSSLKSSLAFDWESDAKGVFTVKNIDLRIGLKLDGYDKLEGTYGACIVKSSDLGESKLVDLIKSYNKSTMEDVVTQNDKLVLATTSVENGVVCTKLEDISITEEYTVVIYAQTETGIYFTKEIELSVASLSRLYLEMADDLDLSFEVIESLKTLIVE